MFQKILVSVDLTDVHQPTLDVERLICHYLARSCCVNHRVRQVAAHEADVVIHWQYVRALAAGSAGGLASHRRHGTAP
jgi:hypothetical protein